MKIIELQQFLSLPSGVLYAKFEPYVFGDIAIKEASMSNDWLYQDLLELKARSNEEWDDILSKAVEKGTSFNLDYECVGRDGLYKSDQLFAVFEKEDVVSLVRRLEKTLSDYPEI